MACGFYSLIVTAFLEGASPEAAYHWAINMSRPTYSRPTYSYEVPHFDRLFFEGLHQLDESEISPAAMW
jgi:hypothetical protein